jgi:putative transcriptional regulator
MFALYLNVSPNAVRSWEQGTRKPQQAALKLLAIAKRNPRALLSA